MNDSNLLHPSSYFNLNQEMPIQLFKGCRYAWDALVHLEKHLDRLVGTKRTILGQVDPAAVLSDQPVFIAKGAQVAPTAFIQGPAYIGPGVVIRHGAYVREGVILLAGSVLGHASEAKNSIFLPGAQAPHFAYVGDSILGHQVNLGAGTKLSNLSLLSEKDPSTGKRPSIKIRVTGIEYDTGLSKLGGILGDRVQTGCNVVLNPGCLVGKDTLIYAGVSLGKGCYPAQSIIKLRQNLETTERIMNS